MISSSSRHSRSAQRRPWRSLQQQLLGLGAAFVERGLQPLRQRGAQFALAAAMGLGEAFQVGGDGADIDQLARVPGRMLGRRARAGFEGERGHGGIGIAEAGLEVTRSAAKIFANARIGGSGDQFFGILQLRRRLGCGFAVTSGSRSMVPWRPTVE